MLARAFVERVLRRGGRAAEEDHRARDARAPGAQLARQRARAAQPDGAARDHDAGPDDRPAGPAGRGAHGRARRGRGARRRSRRRAARSSASSCSRGSPSTAGTSRAPPRRSASRARASRARSRRYGIEVEQADERGAPPHAAIRGDGRVVSLADEGGVNRRLVLALPRLARRRARTVRDALAGRARLGAALRSAAAAADGGLSHARGRRRRSAARDPVQGARARHGAARRRSSRATRVGVVGPLGTPFPDPAAGRARA